MVVIKEVRNRKSSRNQKSRNNVVAISSVRRRQKPEDFVGSITNAITASLNRTYFVLTLVAVTAFVFTFKSIDDGPIAKILPADSTNTFVQWARSNVPKVLGALLYIPAIIDAPSKHQVLLGAMVMLWVYLVPESTPYEYAIQATLLHVFLHVRGKTRLVIVAIAAIAYFGGFVVFSPQNTPSPSAMPSSSSTPQSAARIVDNPTQKDVAQAQQNTKNFNQAFHKYS